MTHVPYQGDAPSIVDLIGGHVAMTVSPVPRSLPHVRGGRLKALGVTSANRVPAAPEIPTIAEAGLPGYEAVQWYGLLAPAGTPKDIIARLNAAIVKAVSAPDMKEAFFKQGLDIQTNTPEQFVAFMRRELAQNAKVVQFAGIRAE